MYKTSLQKSKQWHIESFRSKINIKIEFMIYIIMYSKLYASVFDICDMDSNCYSSYFVCLKSSNSTIKPTFTFNIVGLVHWKSVNKTPRVIFTESRWTIVVSFIFPKWTRILQQNSKVCYISKIDPCQSRNVWFKLSLIFELYDLLWVLTDYSIIPIVYLSHLLEQLNPSPL